MFRTSTSDESYVWTRGREELEGVEEIELIDGRVPRLEQEVLVDGPEMDKYVVVDGVADIGEG